MTEILSRDDLDQLSPLKFYVITGGPVVDNLVTDVVATGRIKVDLDAWRAMHADVRTEAPVNQKVERSAQNKMDALQSTNTTLRSSNMTRPWRSTARAG